MVRKMPEKNEKKECCGSSARKSTGNEKIEDEGEEESFPPEIVVIEQETARQVERVIAVAEGGECQCDREREERSRTAKIYLQRDRQLCRHQQRQFLQEEWNAYRQLCKQREKACKNATRFEKRSPAIVHSDAFPELSLEKTSFSSSLSSSSSPFLPTSSSHSSSSLTLSLTTSSLSIPSVGLLNVHLNCFPLPQRRIPLCFSTLYGFRSPAVLNELKGNEKGKDLPAISHSSSHFAAS
ncbi:uncharacterized protein MONOS_7220 [Monocercomonoides exilis]|uniref:uncharacterized protein n=1 Tax=Monocercomonoides exilis TaxID=2049356 RepID=UPI00355ABCCD|nr:hypothetical protein MONOS_7220 [Monocercomonoides exilis]|eukprot:MONOS_7220.1-p1 / transcript=MONOS_7220.1 / gene=MONOS_7220 / organism=Monocercomonoides_exilis_PA203 / gene_product=unspecified product / transcript_product=unspecified product / location=Mono_scaffold00241:58480-59391(+) / protein_length=239 / sequence_SO=supercontig / SO=protein_coding / is_pseudo=false